MRVIKLVIAIGIVGGLCAMSACKKNDPLPETERVKALLKANSWRVQNVTVDGVDQSPLFTGLVLSFTEKTYSTTNGGLVWPSSGTWEFSDGSGTKVKRNDGVEIAIEEASATNLKLSLTWATGTLGSGRASSVAGKHMFSFIK